MARGRAYGTGVAAFGLAIIGIAASAQIAEEDGGARLEADLGFRLEVIDGEPELRTGFDLDLITATRTQRLSFSGDFGVTVPLDDPEALSSNDPRYGLEYLRDNGRSRLSFGASYSETDISRLRFLDPEPGAEIDEELLTTSDDGSRERRQVSARLELGLDAPVGATLSYSYDETFYTGTTDPDLVDTRRDDASIALRFDIDPTLRVVLDGSWSETEEQGLLPTTETTLGFGLTTTWQARPELLLEAAITQRRIETETLFLGRTVREGLDLSFGAVLDRPNGDLRLEASRSVFAPGVVTRATLARSLALPRGGEITARLGATDLPTGNLYAIGDIAFSREMRGGGALALSLGHDVTLDGDDNEVARTVLRARYDADLPGGASWSLSGRLSNSDFLTGAEPDIAAARLSLSYRQPLTEDWNFATGLSWQMTRETDTDIEDSDTRVFLTLERRFTFRR